VPVEQQTCSPTAKVEQNVKLGLKVVKAAAVTPHLLASDPHPSPETTGIDAQVPSEFDEGPVTGRVPDEQHTLCPTARVEHNVEPGFKVVKAAAVIPHLTAREPQLSPEATWTIEQAARA